MPVKTAQHTVQHGGFTCGSRRTARVVGPTWEEAGETRVKQTRQGAHLFGGNCFEFLGADVVPVAKVSADTTIQPWQPRPVAVLKHSALHALQLPHLRNSCDIVGVMTAGPTPMASASSPSA
jgi:hypothetical protein